MLRQASRFLLYGKPLFAFASLTLLTENLFTFNVALFAMFNTSTLRNGSRHVNLRPCRSHYFATARFVHRLVITLLRPSRDERPHRIIHDRASVSSSICPTHIHPADVKRLTPPETHKLTNSRTGLRTLFSYKSPRAEGSDPQDCARASERESNCRISRPRDGAPSVTSTHSQSPSFTLDANLTPATPRSPFTARISKQADGGPMGRTRHGNGTRFRRPTWTSNFRR